MPIHFVFLLPSLFQSYFPYSSFPSTSIQLAGLGKRHKLPAWSRRSLAANASICLVLGWPQFWHDRWWTSVIKRQAQQKVTSSHKSWRGRVPRVHRAVASMDVRACVWTVTFVLNELCTKCLTRWSQLQNLGSRSQVKFTTTSWKMSRLQLQMQPIGGKLKMFWKTNYGGVHENGGGNDTSVGYDMAKSRLRALYWVPLL